MPYAGLPGFPPTLLLGLLACLPQVAAVCDPDTCPPGYQCCYYTCCKINESFSSLKLFITATFSIGLLLCLCGVVKSFCCKCKDPEPEMGLTMDYCMDPQMTHPRPPPEEVRAPFPEYPPPYHEVIRRPDQDLPHREPPPPYSFRPEGYWGTSRGIDNPAF